MGASIAGSPRALVLVAHKDTRDRESRNQSFEGFRTLGSGEQLHRPPLDDDVEWAGADRRIDEIARDARGRQSLCVREFRCSKDVHCSSPPRDLQGYRFFPPTPGTAAT